MANPSHGTSLRSASAATAYSEGGAVTMKKIWVKPILAEILPDEPEFLAAAREICKIFGAPPTIVSFPDRTFKRLE